MHQGIKAGGQRTTIDEYYQSYLPSHLQEFSSILEESSVGAVYFGGGTADIMPADEMPRIFSSIPGFMNIPCKVFEAHPATLSPKQMEQIALHHFAGGYVSFGLQTFDKEICSRENRIYTSPSKLREKVDFLRTAGVSVNVDLVAFLSSPDLHSLDVLKQDLTILRNEVGPDIITIYPLRQAFNYLNQLTQLVKASGDEHDKLVAHRMLLATGLMDVIALFSSCDSGYSQWLAPDVRTKGLQEDLVEACMRPSYLSRLPEYRTDRIRSYNSSTPPFHDRKRSVIGFGNYGRIYSHSYIQDEIAYYTMNDGWKTRYFVVHDKSIPALNLDQQGWEVADL